MASNLGGPTPIWRQSLVRVRGNFLDYLPLEAVLNRPAQNLNLNILRAHYCPARLLRDLEDFDVRAHADLSAFFRLLGLFSRTP